MKPDLEKAALAATETLIKHRVSFAPVVPLPLLKSMPGVLVTSFAEMAERMGLERERVVSAFGDDNRDAVTHVRDGDSRIRYIVTYNQRLPFYMLQRAMARELGHIVLGHDGSRPEEVRMEEAIVFARHLLCPRPLIRAIEESGVPLTVDTVGTITGCFERCITGLQKTPGPMFRQRSTESSGSSSRIM